jgi:hypothetical protein
MYRFIKELFRQNWTLNQIAYVKRNYRKLFSIIRNRKNKLKKKRISTRMTSYISRIRIDQILCYVNFYIYFYIDFYICLYIDFYIYFCIDFFICFFNIFTSCWIIKRSINSTIKCSTNLEIIIIINSYSLWHRLETIHAKDIIYFTERKIIKKKKKFFILIQSSSRFLNDVTLFKNRANNVFNSFIRCHFQYQELKIVCVIDQTSEMSNF